MEQILEYPDRDLIDELKRRGYRVFWHECVQELCCGEMLIDNFDHLSDYVKDKMVNDVWRRLDASLLSALSQHNIFGHKTNDSQKSMPMGGRIYTSELVVVKPI